MAKKIVNLTKFYGDYPKIVGRKMMLRYANKDWDYDVVFYLDETIRCMEEDTPENMEAARHSLDYWKYMFLEAKGNHKEAMQYLKKSCDRAGPDAVAQYGYFYYTGSGVTNIVNRSKARRLFKYALSNQSMFAEYLYAQAITYGNENDLNVLLEAIPYYERALEKGVILARYNLADCYLKTGEDLDRAIELFEKCEEKDANDKKVEAMRIRLNKGNKK